MPFSLPDLPYAHDALEPTIDARTMEIHHGKHHQAYVDNANKALEGTDLADAPVEEVLATLGSAAGGQASPAVRNNAGGHANHSLFWTIMSPDGGGEPEGALADAIDAFGGLAALKEQVNDAGVKRFGSGWTWLVADGGSLSVLSTANQDSPISRRQDADPRHRRLGARLLPQLPEPAPGLPGGVVGCGQLGRGGEAVRAGKLTPARSSPAAPASSARQSWNGCAGKAGRWSRREAVTATSPTPTRPARSSARAAAELGGLDVVVNGAGAGFEARRFEEVSEEDVDRAFGATVKGSFFVTQAAVPHLRESRGLVIMLEDVAAYQPWPAFAAHGAAKAAQAMLTRTLAKALAPEIRVCGIAPGPVALEPGDNEARRAAETALRRVGSPDDVAEAILYLAGADFVTGTTIAVDGGRLLQTGSPGHA